MSSSIKKLVSRIANRTLVRDIACPECGAQPGQRCVGVRVERRTANHQARWDAYRDQQRIPTPEGQDEGIEQAIHQTNT